MKLKKIGVATLAIFALLVALSVTSHFYISFQTSAAQKQKEQSYARERLTPEEIREDIAFFQSLLERVHPREIESFPIGDAEAALVGLINAPDRVLTKLAFYKEITPVGNLLSDEHTMVFPAEIDSQSIYEAEARLFPFDVQFVDNRLFVVRNLSSQSSIQAGTEILSINDISIEDLRTTLMKFYSGTRDEQKAFYAQEKFREGLYFVFGFGEKFELIVRVAAVGEVKRYVVSGRRFSQPEVREFHYEVMDHDTILFTYNAFEDKEDYFADFLQDMFATAQQSDIRHLIIDIRANQGGATAYGDEILAYLMSEPFTQISHVDVTISEEVKSDFISYVPAFIRWFPVQYFHPTLKPLWRNEVGETAVVTFDPVEPRDSNLHFSGDVYLLVGPGTMSSASLFAATLQKHNVGTLIGEPPGGYATLYGSVIDMYLPNSGLKVWMPTSVIYGNGTGLIVPDHIVKQTVPDLVGGRDTVLEFARHLARSD